MSNELNENPTIEQLKDIKFWETHELEAIDECVINPSGHKSLVIGKKYSPIETHPKALFIESEADERHWFKYKTIFKFFKVIQKTMITAEDILNDPKYREMDCDTLDDEICEIPQEEFRKLTNMRDYDGRRFSIAAWLIAYYYPNNPIKPKSAFEAMTAEEFIDELFKLPKEKMMEFSKRLDIVLKSLATQIRVPQIEQMKEMKFWETHQLEATANRKDSPKHNNIIITQGRCYPVLRCSPRIVVKDNYGYEYYVQLSQIECFEGDDDASYFRIIPKEPATIAQTLPPLNTKGIFDNIITEEFGKSQEDIKTSFTILTHNRKFKSAEPAGGDIIKQINRAMAIGEAFSFESTKGTVTIGADAMKNAVLILNHS